jgi:SAM-dependent methyltransferase
VSTLVSGEAYVTALDRASADRECRSAFRNLATSLLRPGDKVFDFGSGPGLDARHYAEHDAEVTGYDIDPDMRAYFGRHCAEQIARGAIRQHAASYPDFLREPLPWPGCVNLITANFAPVNLVPDPQELFARFRTMLVTNGHVLVSVLNPMNFGDARYAWWWRNLPRLVMRGQYSVAGAQAPVTRYQPKRLAAMAAAHFALQAVYEDRCPDPASVLPAQLRPGPRAWRKMARCRFLFLLFRTRDPET